MNTNSGWKIIKHVLYIADFFNEENDPCTSSCRLHSHQNFPGSKYQYQAIQAGITRVAMPSLPFTPLVIPPWL